MIEKSSCSITSLTLWAASIKPDEWVILFSTMHGLTFLSIAVYEREEVCQELLDALSITQGHPPCLPQLSTFLFSAHYGIDYTILLSIVDIINSRKAADLIYPDGSVARLESASLRLPVDKFSEPELSSIRERAGGIELDLRFKVRELMKPYWPRNNHPKGYITERIEI